MNDEPSLAELEIDYDSFVTEALPDVAVHVSTDRDDCARAANDVGSLFIRVPACGAEWIELRGVRQVNQPIRSGAVRFAQQEVA